ncbi:YuiB family protein [Cytobacillus purgationiresistens]|uniref:Purine-cytosine permease-like protein n=1 Tax=Cytobacillus purgationiresistens TaxID=863449 RepID=A0ABU0ALG1_9BACI|nr:YuiB family protein [Cytobacillus purgationiresistens]MDQ0270860.1 purine-cytosine permease-like protein [Cytobacillus purgationiresistens]
MQMTIFILPISMLLFFVLFFGIGFILNMLLRMSWIMAVIYPFITILIIDKVRFIEYFNNTKDSFSSLWTEITSLAIADVLILSSGMAGAIVAGIVIKMLRNRGYRMF